MRKAWNFNDGKYNSKEENRGGVRDLMLFLNISKMELRKVAGVRIQSVKRSKPMR